MVSLPADSFVFIGQYQCTVTAVDPMISAYLREHGWILVGPSTDPAYPTGIVYATTSMELAFQAIASLRQVVFHL